MLSLFSACGPELTSTDHRMSASVKSGNARNEPMMSAFHPIDGVIGRQLVDS